jgi:hypothetical protein
MKRIAVVNREFVAEHGLAVSGGPFAGMRYLPGLEETQGDLVGKLLGTYESELHGAVRSWFSAPISLVVNVGCAEGYYAVGFARAMPDARVLAYDIDPEARRLCSALAETNGAARRVAVRGECTPAVLMDLPPEGVAVFCDCEGYELMLLDPASVPALRRWPVIVELHDQLDPAITTEICRRFDTSHDVQVIRSVPPASVPPELASVPARRRSLVLQERPVPMNWAQMTPRRP